MGPMDKIINLLKINPDDDEFVDDGDYDDDSMDTPKKSVTVKEMPQDNTVPVQEKFKKPITKQPARSAKKLGNGMEVCLMKPTSVDEAREVTEILLENHTVVLNLEGVDISIAQRIIDFTAGTTLAIKGNMQKISNFIFLVTPSNVDVSGDFSNALSGSFDTPL